MDENQFRILIKECDTLLIQNSHSLSRISIAWLHVIREHPIFLTNYEKIFASSIIHNRYQWLGVKRIFIELVRVFRQLSRGLKASCINFKGGNKLDKTDVIIVSHLLNTPQKSSDLDIYFGDLPKTLIEHGYKVTQILIDQTNHSSNAFNQLLESNIGQRRVLLSNSLGFFSEVKMLFCFFRESAALLPQVNNNSIKSRVRVAAAAEALSSASCNAMRIGLQVAKICKQSKPKLLITTFEGHAWERAVFLQSRLSFPALRCAGYQHSTLFRLQHGLRRFINSACDPDIVLTSGEHALHELSDSLVGFNQLITNLGSLRAGKLIKLSANELFIREQQLSCLVIPEGLDSEAILIFKYTINCAVKLPHIRFIWRLHPVLPFEFLLKKYSFLASLPPNIVLSSASLEEDAKQSKWVLYRGSSAVITSIMAGAGPIYLSIKNEMTLDPLFNELLHAVVETEDDLVNLLQHTNYPTTDDLRQITKHCTGVFSPLRPQVLLDCLSGIN